MVAELVDAAFNIIYHEICLMFWMFMFGLTLKKRHALYNSFLTSYGETAFRLDQIIEFGAGIMKKARIHHHFHDDFSLQANAKSLAEFAVRGFQCNPSKLTLKQAEFIISLFERRISERIPVEYIINEAKYLDKRFYVNENVLVPRSLMGHRFNDFLNEVHWSNFKVLDLCTGSGCIGISLALLHPQIHVVLADISEKALEVASINIKKHHLEARVSIIKSDLFSEIDDKFDLIISNPPYVPTSEYKRSPEEFKNEPKIALESGSKGLDIVDRMISESKKLLNKNGTMIVEVGVTTAKIIKRRYKDLNLEWFKYRRPSGKESFFGMHCVFRVMGMHLP